VRVYDPVGSYIDDDFSITNNSVIPWSQALGGGGHAPPPSADPLR